MATNPPKNNSRVGSVRERTQFEHNGTHYKRDTTTGRIIDGKKSDGPYKGVAKEPDGRRKK
jgi:hypothetical protein